MSNWIPGLAADDVARLLTTNIKRPDDQDATAFNDQAAGLKAIRSATMDLLDRVAVAEGQLASLPFPFRAP